MKYISIVAALFILEVTVQRVLGQSTYFLATYEANSQYLKGNKNGRVECSRGSSNALKFNLLSPGLTSVRNGVSFRSADFERYYLVDVGGVAYLRPFDNTRAFQQSASFAERKNYYFEGTVSYESIDYPGDFLYCQRGLLRVSKPSSQDDAARASFFTEEAPDDLWGKCSVTCGGGIQYPKRRTCLVPRVFCEELRSRPCNTQRCPSSNPCRPNPCLHGGRCQRWENSYVCRCPAGYTGKNCGETPNPCGSMPCQNGGKCQRKGNSYVCRCPAGFQGKNCDKSTDPCRCNPCLNGGRCFSAGKDYVCSCAPGYSGDNCQNADNPCKSRPCQNGGTCKKMGRDFTCQCRSGFTGKTCEDAVDPCRPNPCENGGFCRSNGLDYRCTCRSGFTGEKCEQAINPCASRPCQNGGSCRRSGTGFMCECGPGWTGTLCESPINPCASRPCQNGGSCRRSGTGFVCQCRAGWTGTLCETSAAQTCSPNPCRNGGVCIKTGTGYKCKCAIGYTGNRCQTKLGIGEWSSCTQSCEGGTRYRGKECDENDVTKCPREYEDCNLQECTQAEDCSASSLTLRFGSRTKCCAKSSGTCGTPTLGRSQPRIIGGVDSRSGQWPWMVAIYNKPADAFYCGGSIVNNNWIVTAGHCVQPYPVSDIRVLIGTKGRSQPEAGHKWLDISQKIVHPSYDNPIDDVALIKVKEPITFTARIKPICFPNGERLEEDSTCFAAGWGIAFVKDIPLRKASDKLKHVGIRTLPLDACVQGFAGTGYERGVNSKIICSGLLGGGKDTCLGDSGGPLVCQRKNSCEWYLAGITSFGPTECGVGNIPGGFMDVAQYESWIKKNIS